MIVFGNIQYQRVFVSTRFLTKIKQKFMALSNLFKNRLFDDFKLFLHLRDIKRTIHKF